MTTTYLPPLLGTYPDTRELVEAIPSGPAFGRTRQMNRWHRIRSGYRALREWDPDTIHEVWHAWCGYSIFGIKAPIFADEPFAGEPVCGTCEGRYRGHSPDHPDWIFTPRHLEPPRICPGSQSQLYRVGAAWNRGTCLVCQEPVKLRGYGGSRYYDGWFGPQRHPPGELFIDPCPVHGWRHIVRLPDDSIACQCTR